MITAQPREKNLLDREQSERVAHGLSRPRVDRAGRRSRRLFPGVGSAIREQAHLLEPVVLDATTGTDLPKIEFAAGHRVSDRACDPI